MLIRDYPIVKKIHQLLINNEVDFSDELDYYDLASTIIGGLPEWPQLGSDGDYEYLDLENFHIYEILPEEMIVSGGGDWQEGLMLRIVLKGDQLIGEIIPFDLERTEYRYDMIMEIFTPTNDLNGSN